MNFSFFLALLSGLLLCCGFPPFDWPGVAWIPFFAMVPLCWVILCGPLPTLWLKKMGIVFLWGYSAGFVFFVLTLEWVRVVAWEGVVGLPLYLALYPGVWALLMLSIRNYGEIGFWHSSVKNLLVAIFAAASWVSLEWIRGLLFTGFGWNSLGVAFHRVIPLIQIIDLTGLSGLSFLAILTSCITALGFQRFYLKVFVSQKQLKSTATLERIKPLQIFPRSPLDILVTLFLVVGVMSYGLREMLTPLPPQEQILTAAMQGNIPQNHKWDRAFEASIMDTYRRYSEKAMTLHPDLIIWPEAATPQPLLLHLPTFEQIYLLAQKSGSDFLIGSLHYEEHPQKDYNAAILITDKGNTSDYYAKTHLVPFGEYIPCRKSFPLFQWIVGDRVLGDFDAGPGPKLLALSTKPIKIGPLLCFEDTLGDLVRRFAGLGAQALITLTNDGWFGQTAASRQHVVNALFRCAETKLPMLRVANNGVTCLIDRFGRITETLQTPDGNIFIEGVLASHWNVPKNPKPTFYTRHGDWFSKACLLWCGIVLLILFVRRKNRSLDA